ncbi:hypothetical protein ACFV4F_35210 [Kitasatospora sp. NPDC059722]|uniref:hypothetical protein n=1 Tax=Kitasatospora sp. NPDC059722 TaxID=3346925 RepID=UPI0036C9229F
MTRGAARIGEEQREEWRTDLDPKIQAVRYLARRYGAQLLAADGMFAGLAAVATPEHWSAGGVHPTAGRARRARGGLAASGRVIGARGVEPDCAPGGLNPFRRGLRQHL